MFFARFVIYIYYQFLYFQFNVVYLNHTCTSWEVFLNFMWILHIVQTSTFKSLWFLSSVTISFIHWKHDKYKCDKHVYVNSNKYNIITIRYQNNGLCSNYYIMLPMLLILRFYNSRYATNVITKTPVNKVSLVNYFTFLSFYFPNKRHVMHKGIWYNLYEPFEFVTFWTAWTISAFLIFCYLMHVTCKSFELNTHVFDYHTKFYNIAILAYVFHTMCILTYPCIW